MGDVLHGSRGDLLAALDEGAHRLLVLSEGGRIVRSVLAELLGQRYGAEQGSVGAEAGEGIDAVRRVSDEDDSAS